MYVVASFWVARISVIISGISVAMAFSGSACEELFNGLQRQRKQANRSVNGWLVNAWRNKWRRSNHRLPIWPVASSVS